MSKHEVHFDELFFEPLNRQVVDPVSLGAAASLMAVLIDAGVERPAAVTAHIHFLAESGKKIRKVIFN